MAHSVGQFGGQRESGLGGHSVLAVYQQEHGLYAATASDSGHTQGE